MSARSPAWRSLGWFWGVVVVAAAGGAGTLQVLGPPAPGHGAAPAAMHLATATTGHDAPAQATEAHGTDAHGAADHGSTEHGGAGHGSDEHAADAHAATPPATLATDGSYVIPPPSPALLEASPLFPDGQLPRRSPDGGSPLALYARPAEPAQGRPRIALLIAGIGLSQADSQAAIALPGPVDLAFSPYAQQPQALLQAARAAGHEMLVSIPMEPQGYPLNDEGAHALLTTATADANARNLEWALTRIQGYAGATGASDGLRGERFAALSGSMAPVTDEFAARGLMYIDPRPDVPPPVNLAGRSVDIVVDSPPLRAEIDAKLGQLEALARDHGAALGLIGPPRPVTMERVAAWIAGLSQRGFVLVPVSAIVQKPSRPPPAPRLAVVREAPAAAPHGASANEHAPAAHH